MDIGDILMAGDERTYELIDKMFRTLAECFTTQRVNIGMDEAILVGLGKYLQINGYRNRFEIMIRHLERVMDIAAKYGFRCAIWSDMFFRLAFDGEYYPGPNERLPKEVADRIPRKAELIYWDYYSVDQSHYENMLDKHSAADNALHVAAGAWTWVGFLPHNKFAMEQYAASIAACRRYDVRDYIVTAWGDDGAECPVFAALPTLHYAAEIAYGVTDKEAIARSFETAQARR